MNPYNIANIEETDLGFRLSPIQRRLWSLHRISPVFRATAVFFIDGAVDRHKLKRALDQLAGRHEILRTRFSVLPGTDIPVQRIETEAGYRFHLREWAEAHASEEAIVESVLREIVETAGLADEPLFQVTVVARSAARTLLVFSLPAICGDSETLRILCRELILSCNGGDPGSVSEPVQFAEIAEWQNSLLEEEDTESGRNYWRKFHANETAVLPVFSGARFDFSSMAVPLDAALLNAGKSVAARSAASFADFSLACWQVLLWRVKGQSSFTTGVLCDGRKYEELATAPGPFQKYLPLSLDLQPGLTFTDLLRALQEKRNEIARLQEFFEWPAHTKDGSARGTPFLAVCFDAEPSAAFSGDNYGVVREDFCCDLFEIKLRIVAAEAGPKIEISYDPAVYSHQYVGCVAESFRALLKSASTSLDCEIRDLNIISDEQRRELVTGVNATETDYPLDKCLHHLFEERLPLHSNAPAVRVGQTEFSYESLNRRANQLAHFLRNSGVGAEDPVVICLEHSIELFIALLAVLKAGAAYVPLDPETPPERMAFVLQDARLRLVLTSAGLRANVPENQGIQILCLDALDKNLSCQSEENPSVPVLPGQLAYIIYTSGSTGRPKGVMVTHRGLTNYLLWATGAYTTSRAGGVPVFSSLGFDLTITSLFVPLLAGDTAILFPGQNNLESLAEATGFTFAKLTPAHLQVLMQYLSREETLNWAGALVLGGEALSTELVSSCVTRNPEARIFNEYGPTETVVGCCVQELGQADVARGTMPIGRPIANMKMYVVDEAMRPVPVGVTGELYIGGVGLARGYVGSPELTAERFVPDPFAHIGGSRLYRTGDLGRWLPDHTIEFLGRTDHQIKLRGFRIELGEIESLLEQLAEVRQAVVVVREDQPGDKRLVAYFVPADPNLAGAAKIRQALKQMLPDYMVPSAFVPLKAMPLTANGKIDRRALPHPARQSKAIICEYSAPQGAVEMEIAQIWEEILKVARVGRNDDFFDLGGHSLLAVRMIARIANSFAVQLPVATLFEASTLAKFASAVERSRNEASPSSPLVLIRNSGSGRPLYLVESDPGLRYQEMLAYLPEERPLYSLQPAPIAEDAEPDSMEQTAERYVKAVLQKDPDGPYFLVGHSLAGLVAFEMAQQLIRQKKEVAFLGVLDMALDGPKLPDNADDTTVLAHLFARQFGTGTEEFRRLSPVAQIERIAEAAQKLGRIPSGIQRQDIFRHIDRWKANQRALSKYHPQPYGGRIVVFKASEKLPFRYYSLDPAMGWGRVAGNIRIMDVPGNHYTLLNNPDVQEVARQLWRCIDEIGTQW